MAGTGIGTFNDRLRDAVRGGGPFDDDPRIQGFGSGLSTDPNGDAGQRHGRRAAARLLHDTDLIKVGLAGNLRRLHASPTAPARRSRGRPGRLQRPARRLRRPARTRSITYVDAHDNETLFDALTYKLPRSTVDGRPGADEHRCRWPPPRSPRRRRSGTRAPTCCAASRWTATATTRGDWFNRLDWTGADNGFGPGLPPEADNEAKWPFMKPLLANPRSSRQPADVQAASRPGAGAAAAALLLAAVPAGLRAGHRGQGRLPRSRDAGRPSGGGRDADRRHRRSRTPTRR